MHDELIEQQIKTRELEYEIMTERIADTLDVLKLM